MNRRELVSWIVGLAVGLWSGTSIETAAPAPLRVSTDEPLQGCHYWYYAPWGQWVLFFQIDQKNGVGDLMYLPEEGKAYFYRAYHNVWTHDEEAKDYESVRAGSIEETLAMLVEGLRPEYRPHVMIQKASLERYYNSGGNV